MFLYNIVSGQLAPIVINNNNNHVKVLSVLCALWVESVLLCTRVHSCHCCC